MMANGLKGLFLSVVLFFLAHRVFISRSVAGCQVSQRFKNVQDKVRELDRGYELLKQILDSHKREQGTLSDEVFSISRTLLPIQHRVIRINESIWEKLANVDYQLIALRRQLAQTHHTLSLQVEQLRDQQSNIMKLLNTERTSTSTTTSTPTSQKTTTLSASSSDDETRRTTSGIPLVGGSSGSTDNSNQPTSSISSVFETPTDQRTSAAPSETPEIEDIKVVLDE